MIGGGTSRRWPCGRGERKSRQPAVERRLEVGKAFPRAVVGIKTAYCGGAYELPIATRVFAVRLVWVRIFGDVGSGGDLRALALRRGFIAAQGTARGYGFAARVRPVRRRYSSSVRGAFSTHSRAPSGLLRKYSVATRSRAPVRWVAADVGIERAHSAAEAGSFAEVLSMKPRTAAA